MNIIHKTSKGDLNGARPIAPPRPERKQLRAPLPAMEMRPVPVRSGADLARALETADALSGHRLGEYLTACGLVGQDEIHHALRARTLVGPKIGHMLLREGLCDEDQLNWAIAAKLGMPFVDISELHIDASVAGILPDDYLRMHQILPLMRLDAHLIIAVTDPTSTVISDEVRAIARQRVIPLFVNRVQLERRIASLTDEPAMQAAEKRVSSWVADMEDAIVKADDGDPEKRDNPLVLLLDGMLRRAVLAGASDIAFQPGSDRISVTMRINGAVELERTLPIGIMDSLANRVRAMASMLSPKRNQAEDGSMLIRVGARALNVRVSILPSVFGPNLSLRILDDSRNLRTLAQMRYPDPVVRNLRQVLRQHSGLLLVTGATGHGKSTAMFAMLREMMQRQMHIVTVEDPVECTLEGLTQVEVEPRHGMNFPTVLRHVLRHDPDVIMVGEIRDSETANLAVRAASTGHLVLTTLHTANAVDAIVRLRDLEVEASEIATALSGVLTQRLVRENCPNCLVPDPASNEAVRELGIDLGGGASVSTGCAACGERGYIGRIPIVEFLHVDAKLRELISADKPSRELLQHAYQTGMRSLGENAVDLLRQGQVSMSEIAPLLQRERQGWLRHDGPDPQLRLITPHLGPTDPNLAH